MKRWRVLSVVLGAMLIVGVTLSNALATAERQTPKTDFGVYRIQLQVGKEIAGEFQEVSGLESEVEVVEYRDGDDPIIHKRPGRTKFKNIVLRRDAGSSETVLAEWYKKVLDGKVDRKSGSIIFLDRADREVARYNFFEAWPCRWQGPELNSNSDDHIVEEIEFVVERVERS